MTQLRTEVTAELSVLRGGVVGTDTRLAGVEALIPRSDFK